MSLPGCETPILSTSELTLWWTALLATHRHEPSMSMLWLDRAGRMLGRVLCVTGVQQAPSRIAMAGLMNAHCAVVDRVGAAPGHLALALSRPGASDISEDDEKWAEALHLDLDDLTDESWSLHLATGGWVVPLVEPLAWRLRPRGIRGQLLDAALAVHRSR